MNKLGYWMIGIAILFFGCNIVWATEPHRIVIDTQTAAPILQYRGTALGIATAQHHFNFGDFAWQGSISKGWYQDANATSFSLGKRYKDTLINGSVGMENGETGYGVGITFRFQ